MICGPTAAGKSTVALRLATQFGAGIISADSRQVYRGFDIGTAKPSLVERARVPHQGISVLDPTARYSAAAWASDAERWIAETSSAGRPAVIVGGTGFYIRALFETLFREPDLDPGRRAALAGLLDAMPLAELRRWCETLDPARARLGRTQLLRAIEIALLSGRRMSDLHRLAPRPPRLRARYLLVDPGKPLGHRIADRVDDMFRAGWVDEARALAASVPSGAPAWNATGYETVRLAAEGALGADEARERIVIATRQYAKRQRTWFRHQLPAAGVVAVDPERSGWEDVAEQWWTGTPED